MQIANAVCKSRIIGVVTEVISEHASDGIGQEPGSNETHLPRARKERARFRVQLELILEVVEHRSTCTRVLPVFLGDEGVETETFGAVLREVYRARCWPATAEEGKEGFVFGRGKERKPLFAFKKEWKRGAGRRASRVGGHA